MKYLGLFAVGMCLAAAAGCASSPRAYFAADRTRGLAEDGATPVPTQNFIPVDARAASVRIACEARMFQDEPVAGIAIPTLHVRVYIANYGRARFEMRPMSFAAVDEDGVRVPLSASWQDHQRSGIVLADGPSRHRVDLIFRLPEGYEIGKKASFRLLWGFRIGDEEVRHETIFERRGYQPFRDPFFDAAS